jgi:hypothetical protein
VSTPALRGTGGPLFPLAYYTGFLDLLASAPQVEVITYADLSWEGDEDYEGNYPDEFARWQQWLAADPERTQRIYVILQHDVDWAPERTMTVLEAEAERGLRSTAMIFPELVDRRKLGADRVIELLPYDIDHDRLSALEREHGFGVGYHCNAYERAGWDMERAVRQFRVDVEHLRERYDIQVFSPHGGVPGPDSTNNNAVHPPPELRPAVRWVANRHTLRVARSYSDGGILDPKRDIEGRDLRAFVRTWQAGKRYRVLTHPQYYGEDAEPSESLMRAEWYRSLFPRAPTAAEIWQGVAPGDTP